MSDEKDETTKKVEKKETKKPKKSSKEGLTASEAAALAEEQAKVAAVRSQAAKTAAEAAAEEEYQAAAKEAVAKETGEVFTDKRGAEVIFRREMGEPEFWRHKKDLHPPRPVLTQDQEEEISRRVEIPTDQTPKYTPEHVLSPEYGGISNYETGIGSLLDETKLKLERLRNDPNSSKEEIARTEKDLEKLEVLYQNYYNSMNVFRTAKGGREKAQGK